MQIHITKIFALLCYFTLCTVQAEPKLSLTVADIHQQFKQHSLTSEQLVRYYLTRINAIDDHGPKLNAVVQLNPQALLEAQQLDAYYREHGLKGPLHGIPVLLKDNIDTGEGMANTAGSAALANNFPADDAFLVQRLKRAGAIILGKTNLSEWANFRSTHASSGWSGLYGQTKNPYDLDTSPCGSSSGSGVAIAADLAVLAVGTETDGSITCPAAVTGIVGIKPTLGTISRDGIIPIAHSQDTAGPMARSVSDAVIMLSAMVAPDSKDPDALASDIDYMSHLKKDGLRGKRIGVVRNLTGYAPETDRLFEQTLALLKQQGAIIIDHANIETLGQWDDAEFELMLYEFRQGVNQYLERSQSDVPKSLSQLISFNNRHADIEMPYFGQDIFTMAEQKANINSDDYRTALATAKTTAQQGIDAALKKQKLDLLIAPTTQPAWKIDWINGDHYLGSATSPAAVAGYPHITVPMGYVHGLPVGISMFAGKLQEATLIEAAYGFEQASKVRKAPRLQLN